jgi:hypothetical protein
MFGIGGVRLRVGHGLGLYTRGNWVGSVLVNFSIIAKAHVMRLIIDYVKI